MQSVCPRCGADLGEKQQATNVVMGMDVKGCTACGGFLIDYSEAESVLQKAIVHPEETVLIEEQPTQKAKTPLTGSCPYCGGAFSPSPLKFELSGNTVYLDQCTQCQGIWFDSGELSQIFDFAVKEALALGTLDDDLEETFSSTEVMLKCPRCARETEFGRGEIMGIEIDKCRVCKGIWLDTGEIEAIMGEVRLESTGVGKIPSHAPPESTPARAGCPRCSVPLVRWTNTPESLKDVFLDFCPECNGIWFDKGEFSMLFKLFSESPFVKT
jgi:uncharacterized protein